MVLLGHIAEFGSTESQRASPIVRWIANNNGTGVDLFFVLSGFLITGILYETKDRENYFSTFYKRRTLRIFPLYYAVLAVVAVGRVLFPTLYALNTITPIAQVANWTYTTNFLMSFRGWGAEPLFLGHFWSLAVEEQFYLVWPLVVYYCGRDRLIRIAAIGIFAALLLRFILILKWGFPPAYMLLPARMDALLLGSAIAIWIRDDGRMPSWLTSRLTFALAAVAFIAETSVIDMPIHGALLVFRSAFHFTITTTFFGLLMIAALGLVDGANLSRVLSMGALRFFGKYSYAIYVLHLAVIVALPKLIETVQLSAFGKTSQVGLIPFAAFAVALTLALSLTSWHLLELPFLKLKDIVAPSQRPA